MHDLLIHPAIQAGLIPFLVALLTAELFQRIKLSGLAVIAGFVATVYFTSDFSYEPLTTTRKVVWFGIAASVIALPVSLLTWEYWRPILTIIASGTAVWTCWNLLISLPTENELLWIGACIVYVGWTVFWFDGLRAKPMAAGSAGFALGMGSGAVALINASTLFGKFGLALGAASAAYLLIQTVANSRLVCGYSFTLPLSLIAGLVACLATLSSPQTWYVLPVLGLIPIAAHFPVPEKWSVRLQIFVLTLLTLTCAVGATYLAWQHPY